MRALVTGAQGFVGSSVVAHLLTSARNVEVVGVGRSPHLPDTFPHAIGWGDARLPAPLPHDLRRTLADARYRYVSIDVNDRARMTAEIRHFRPEVVIHLASGLRGDDVRHLFRTNLEGTIALVDAIADAAVDVRRLVVGSTGAVYGTGDAAALPFEESAPCRPLDVYAISKLAAEHASRVASARHGIDTVWARIFNVVGAGEDDRHVGPELARQAAEIVHGLRPPTIDAGDLEPTRDFVDVRDVAHALVTIAERGEAGATYNVATGRETPVRALLDAVLDAAGLRTAVEIRRRAVPPSAVRRHVADIHRLRSLGFSPRADLNDSARDMVRYYADEVAAEVLALQPLG